MKNSKFDLQTALVNLINKYEKEGFFEYIKKPIFIHFCNKS